MSIIEISIFGILLVLVTILQSVTAYLYFREFFYFRLEKKVFLSIIFCYMLGIKFIQGEIFVRLVLLLIFLFLLAIITLMGTMEKKIYHVLSFTFSITLCEFIFSMFYGKNGLDIQTKYLKWIFLYFFINIIFILLILAMIKVLVYFREKNSEGLTNKEYLLLSIFPFASLIILYVSIHISYWAKIVSCFCLILINVSYLIIYDSMAKKNYEIQRFSVIEEQNQYYQERIKNQQELIKMKHDLKNIFITIDSFLLKNDMEAVKQQLQGLLEIDGICYDELTGCVAVDSILNVKIQKMKENDILYHLNLQVPSDLKVEEKNILDISAILGNLLDNAMEAVLRLEKDRERRIDIVIQYKEGKLIFHIQNTSNQVQTDFSQVLIKSEKGKERYGIGISSIKERVERLNGYYDFRYADGKYTALILLPMKKGEFL